MSEWDELVKGEEKALEQERKYNEATKGWKIWSDCGVLGTHDYDSKLEFLKSLSNVHYKEEMLGFACGSIERTYESFFKGERTFKVPVEEHKCLLIRDKDVDLYVKAYELWLEKKDDDLEKEAEKFLSERVVKW